VDKLWDFGGMSTVDGEQFDAILVGSGLGSLSTASFLARAGKRVLILERHTILGGFSHTFKRKGFEWDVGVHYVGQVHSPGSLLRRLTDYLTDRELEWAPIEGVYDRIEIAGRRYDYVPGLEAQVAELVREFPEEESRVRAYYQTVFKASRASAWFFGEKSMPPWLSATLGWFLRRRFEKYARRTTYEVIRGFTQNERLLSVLCGQCGDYGLTPKRSSFAIHAIIVEHYLAGASYPVGGAKRLGETLRPAIEAAGGKVLLRADVDKVIVEKGRACGVRLKDGRTFRAPVIVSGIGAPATFRTLLPPEVRLPEKIEAGLRAVGPSLPHLCLYVGLNRSDAELALPKYNVWKYASEDFDAAFADWTGDREAKPPLVYISFPSAKDPSWAAAHPGKATIQVIVPFRYEWVAEWERTGWRRRGEEYEALKARLSARLLETLYEIVPSVCGHVEHHELSTPLSTRHFTGNATGEIYGLEHSPERYLQKWLRPKTFLPGLFLTGQDVVTVGVGGALASGIVTSIAILKKPVILPLFRQV
jgi:all-trans-retinol 13,14-reductase